MRGQSPRPSPSDFAFANGAVVFAPGETQRTVRVPTVDDGVDECVNDRYGDRVDGRETMQLDLSGAPGTRGSWETGRLSASSATTR